MITVTVLSMKTGIPQEITTSAITWGELKSELSAAGIEVEGMKAMNQALEMSYETSSAVLPTEDFVLFLTPEKVKSGKNN